MLRVCEGQVTPSGLEQVGRSGLSHHFPYPTPAVVTNGHMGELVMLIPSWLGRHKATKQDLLPLIGKLSFAAKAVPSAKGRRYWGGGTGEEEVAVSADRDVYLLRGGGTGEVAVSADRDVYLHHHIGLNMEARGGGGGGGYLVVG